MKHLTYSLLTLSLMAATSVHASDTTLSFVNDMTLNGDAYINENHVENGVILTARESQENGNAFTNMSYGNIAQFSAEFEMKLGTGSYSGASGLTFAWVEDPFVSTVGGYGLGFKGMTGYAIEFDTYDSGSWDNSDNHVAVIQNSTTNVLLEEEITDFNLNDAIYRKVQVEFDNGTISVDIDGENYINDFQIANYMASEDYYFGFTAATGNNYDWHKVRNFELSVTPVPEPSTYALMLGGLGMVGFMAYRRRKTAA